MALNFQPYPGAKTKRDMQQEDSQQLRQGFSDLSTGLDSYQAWKANRLKTESDMSRQERDDAFALVKNQIDLLNLSRGQAIVDPATGQTKEYPGVTGYRVDFNDYGIPKLYREDDASAGVRGVTFPPSHKGEVDLAGNQILVPGLRPMPGVKITPDSLKKVKESAQTYENLKAQLKEYEDLYSQVGTKLTGENASRMDAMSVGIKLTLKELQNLGVLNGPDLTLMEKQVPDASGLTAVAKGAASGVMGDPVLPKLGQLRNFMDNRFQSTIRTNGFEMDAPTGKRVRVSNGAETLEIPAEDLAAAQADGFQVVR